LLALLIALAAGALIAWAQLRLPAPAPVTAPAAEFSADRALADVGLVAETPHPIGSAANRAVRERLRARMAELGLAPRSRRDDVVVRTPDGALAGASTETLIGVLPGRDPALPALALMAHFDSVPSAPGAADDGAGVATALEVARAIRARGVPARDVAVILTDGEEAGLMGARGFFAHDPLARRLGLILNLESRGSGGRTLMFETGRDDGGAIALFRRTATRPLAGSLFSAIYARLPNDTDFSIAHQAGFAGFNYAFTGRSFDYHSPTDNIANLQLGALQDMGDQVLGTAAAAAFTPTLPPRARDAVYGGLFGSAMLAYPPAWGWLVLGASTALMAVALLRARRREPVLLGDVARGAGAGLYLVGASAAALRLAAVIGETGRGGAQRILANAPRWEAGLLLLAVGLLLFTAAEAARGRRGPAVLLPLAAGLASCAVVRGLDAIGLGAGVAAALLALAVGARPAGRAGAWAGLLALGLLVAGAAQAAAPLIAYVLAWPLALGALAAAATALAADLRPRSLAALTVLAAIGLGWAGVHAHLVVVVVGRPELLVLPLFMAAMVAWPLAQPAGGAPPARLAGRLFLIAGAAFAVFVRLASPWDARHPRPAFVTYQLDQDAGRAWRISSPELRTAWSDSVLRAEGGRIEPFRHWIWHEPMDAAPARIATTPAPAITLARGSGGVVRVTVAPLAGVRAITVALAPEAPAVLVQAGQAKLAEPLPAGRWTRLRWVAPDPAGLALAIRPSEHSGVQLRYALALDEWPPEVAPPRPPPPGIAPVGRSGEALVTGERKLTW
jgi:hypothetical protein